VTRLADLLAGLSRTADLGFGLPQGEAVRAASLTVLLGRSLDLTDEEVHAGMYAALLLHLGCIGFAHETAAVWGDELAMNAAISRVNTADLKEVATSFVPAMARGRSPLGQARLVVTALTRGPRFELAQANEEELPVLEAAGVFARSAPNLWSVLDQVRRSGLPRLSRPEVPSEIRVPTLLLHGERTTPFFVAAVEDLARRLPDARVAIIAGAGHLGPQLNGAALAAALDPFLSEVTAAA
jgi:pimeloyl-ACP methyl ester carboxylesterase